MKNSAQLVLASILAVGVLGIGYVAFALHAAQDAIQTTQYMTIPDAESAIARNPNDALAHHRLGQMLAGHDTPRSIEELRTAVRLQPKDREAQFELAYELVHARQVDAGKLAYQQLTGEDDRWGRSARRNLETLAHQ